MKPVWGDPSTIDKVNELEMRLCLAGFELGVKGLLVNRNRGAMSFPSPSPERGFVGGTASVELLYLAVGG